MWTFLCSLFLSASSLRMADFERATREDCEGRIQRHAAVERANAQQSIDRIRSELEIVQDKYVHTCG